MNQELNRICLAGPSMCGKTSVAKRLVNDVWLRSRICSLVLDPFKGNWGRGAWVTDNEEYFFGKWDKESGRYDGSGAIWKRRKCLVVVDEGSSTIARDRGLVSVFTKIRHQEHDLLVICHDATDLLPTMRRNLTELILFLQTPESIKMWRSDFPGMKGLEQAVTLERFQYLHCKNFAEAKKGKLTL